MLASRSLLKKQHGCGLIPGKVPTGRAFRRKLLLTTIRRMSDSPNEAAQGTCFEGLLHLFDRNSSKEGCDLDFSCSLDGPKISTTHSDSDSDTLSTTTRGAPCCKRAARGSVVWRPTVNGPWRAMAAVDALAGRNSVENHASFPSRYARPAEAAEKEVPEVEAPEAPEPEPPAPAPEEPPPAEPEEPKPGFLGRFFGKELA
ncbi:unnamed protein product, partial [Effrenium voratum]